MLEFVFDIYISPEQWSEYYRTPSTTVVASSHDGRRVKFAARHLQRFISRDGVRGVFRLVIDAENNFISLDRVR